MNQRIKITLLEETLGLIDRLSKKPGRSRFIDRAIRHEAQAIGRANLKKQLKEGAIKAEGGLTSTTVTGWRLSKNVSIWLSAI